jgi:hypothetical protein
MWANFSNFFFREEKNLPDGTVNVTLEVKNFQSFHGSGPSLKSAKTAAAKLAITTMPWCPTQNQAQGRKHKRTKSDPLYGQLLEKGLGTEHGACHPNYIDRLK